MFLFNVYQVVNNERYYVGQVQALDEESAIKRLVHGNYIWKGHVIIQGKREIKVYTHNTSELKFCACVVQ